MIAHPQIFVLGIWGKNLYDNEEGVSAVFLSQSKVMMS